MPTFSLGARDLSVLLDTTSTKARSLEIVKKLACCVVRVCETALARCLGRQREMMAASPRLSFFSRSAPGGVVGVRFTILFRLYAIFVSLLLVFWSK